MDLQPSAVWWLICICGESLWSAISKMGSGVALAGRRAVKIEINESLKFQKHR